jgi:pimeloyl-ACP methyl ester carboxylesterase
MTRVDLRIDVTGTTRLAESASIAATVHLPEDLPTSGEFPVVCFAKPGGGYSKGYFTEPLPGPSSGVSEAEWHAERGWIFVSVDHIGVGDSSTDHDPRALDFTTVVTASHHAETEILRLLGNGELVEGFPPVVDPLTVGIGQSMGGCLTIIQQGRFRRYDGIGVLGYSALHTRPPAAPGQPEVVSPWFPRDTLLEEPLFVLNGPELAARVEQGGQAEDLGLALAWGFYYDDVDRELIERDLQGFPQRRGEVPIWASATLPGAAAAACVTPGTVTPEAAVITVPILIAMGERDVVPNPRLEATAYLAATSIDLFVCPRMGHMHNFAGTRHQLWERLDNWVDWVRRHREGKNSQQFFR